MIGRLFINKKIPIIIEGVADTRAVASSYCFLMYVCASQNNKIYSNSPLLSLKRQNTITFCNFYSKRALMWKLFCIFAASY